MQLENQDIFTVNIANDSSFRIHKAFPEIRKGSSRLMTLNERK